MNEKPKDYTSTVMRMAGNIAAGMVGSEQWENAQPHYISEFSVKLARQIVADVLECAKFDAETRREG
jgi:hypothetical protein